MGICILGNVYFEAAILTATTTLAASVYFADLMKLDDERASILIFDYKFYNQADDFNYHYAWSYLRRGKFVYIVL